MTHDKIISHWCRFGYFWNKKAVVQHCMLICVEINLYSVLASITQVTGWLLPCCWANIYHALTLRFNTESFFPGAEQSCNAVSESIGQLPLMRVPSSFSRAGTVLRGCWTGRANDTTEVEWKKGGYPIICTNVCDFLK